MIYVGIGLFLTVVLPIFADRAISMMLPKNAVFIDSRRFLFYVLFFAIFFQILVHGNHELLLGFILGNSLCNLFVFEGMACILSLEDQIFIEEEIRNRRRNRSYYFSFSVILVLILSADYLFFRRTGGNQLSRFDGGFLLVLLILFFGIEFRNGAFKNIISEQTCKAIFWFICFLQVVCICVGSYFLVDGIIGLCMEYHIRFSLAGIFLLSWMVQFVNVVFGKDEKVMKTMCDAMSFDVIVFYLCAFGIGAMFHPINISYEEIYALIIMSMFSIVMVWRSRVNQRIAGSLMLTMYVAGAVFMIAWL